jgi:hypothetical protein
MTIEDVDRRIQKALKAFAMSVLIVTDLVIGDDGTGTATGSDGDDYDVELCAGPFGFRSRPMNGAGGLMVKLGGEGGSAFVFGFRDRQYEIAVELGESVAFSASGANTKWDKDGNIISTPTGAGKVQLGGDAHPLPLWDTFETDLKTVINLVLTALTTNCVNGAPLVIAVPPSPAFTTISTFLAELAAHTYESEKATNG